MAGVDLPGVHRGRAAAGPAEADPGHRHAAGPAAHLHRPAGRRHLRRRGRRQHPDHPLRTDRASSRGPAALSTARVPARSQAGRVRLAQVGVQPDLPEADGLVLGADLPLRRRRAPSRPRPGTRAARRPSARPSSGRARKPSARSVSAQALQQPRPVTAPLGRRVDHELLDLAVLARLGVLVRTRHGAGEPDHPPGLDRHQDPVAGLRRPGDGRVPGLGHLLRRHRARASRLRPGRPAAARPRPRRWSAAMPAASPGQARRTESAIGLSGTVTADRSRDDHGVTQITFDGSVMITARSSDVVGEAGQPPEPPSRRLTGLYVWARRPYVSCGVAAGFTAGYHRLRRSTGSDSGRQRV